MRERIPRKIPLFTFELENFRIAKLSSAELLSPSYQRKKILLCTQNNANFTKILGKVTISHRDSELQINVVAAAKDSECMVIRKNVTFIFKRGGWG